MHLLDKIMRQSRSNRRLDELLNQAVSSDLILTDFDGTDVKSPAKRMAYSYLLRPLKLFSPAFLGWAISCFFDLKLNGCEAEGRQWMRFRQRFLSDKNEFNYQIAKYTRNPQAEAFPGLLEFYSLFPNAKKAYLSRNLPQIVDVYARAYGFDMCVPDSFDAKSSVSQVLEAFPDRRRVLFKGDGGSEKFLEVLNGLKEKGYIESLVTIRVAGLLSGRHPDYDLTIPQDYRGLVENLRRVIGQAPATAVYGPAVPACAIGA